MEWIAPIDPDTPRSPQRPWIDASIRRYEQGGRKPAVLMADYVERTGRAKRREAAASEIANGKTMLERFARLDADEPAPSRVQLRPAPADVLGTVVSMGVDLVYETPEGHVIRQLITDSEIVRPEHLRIYATAGALQFEARPGGGSVCRVDLWLLRYEAEPCTGRDRSSRRPFLSSRSGSGRLPEAPRAGRRSAVPEAARRDSPRSARLSRRPLSEICHRDLGRTLAPLRSASPHEPHVDRVQAPLGLRNHCLITSISTVGPEINLAVVAALPR